MSKTHKTKPKAKSKHPTLKRSNNRLTTLDIANAALLGNEPAPRGRLHTLTVKGL